MHMLPTQMLSQYTAGAAPLPYDIMTKATANYILSLASRSALPVPQPLRSYRLRAGAAAAECCW
eukprot:2190847-Pleurochrysis_carterae.AAC.7